MNLLFRKPKDDTVLPEPNKKKVRGKPFTGKGDPRNNLSGRPKLGRSLAERYRNALAEAESDAKGGEYTKLDAMIDILIGKAMGGDQRAIEYLQERGFGKVPDRIELSRGDEDKYDFSLLSTDEAIYLTYLLEKASGEQPAIPKREDWEGAELKRYHLVLTRETDNSIDGVVKDI